MTRDWGEEAQRRLTEISACSAGGDGVTRLPFTDAHRDALDVISGWMEDAGLTPVLDAAGTLVGRREGTGPALLIGSHQDSVRQGGRYDGIMGVALGCLAVEMLKAEGALPDYPIEVLAFADEEGVRFPTALMGPRALAGTFDLAALDMVDAQGQSLRDALAGFGGAPDGIAALKRDPGNIRGYLELHIEQGPVLERADNPLGVVSGICGIERNTVRFIGETGHAGTVPMQGRRDALVAASRAIAEINEAAQSAEELRATVGSLTVRPGVVNAVPNLVEMSLEIRALNDGLRAAFARRALGIITKSAEACGCEARTEKTYEQSAVPCSEPFLALLDESVRAVQGTSERLPSGATHDASAMADLCDIAMLFLRCRGGISHRPDEYASAKDMGAAIRATGDFMTRLSET